VLRGFWSESGCFSDLTQFLDFCDFAVARGLHDDVADGLFNTLIQVMVPDALRGRVMASIPYCHGHGSDWSFVWRRSRRRLGFRVTVAIAV